MHAFSSDMTQANGSTMLSSLETAASEARTFKQVISNFRTETTTKNIITLLNNMNGLEEEQLVLLKALLLMKEQLLNQINY